jgi:hypothetical protein
MSLASSPDRDKPPNCYLLKVMHKKLSVSRLKRAVVEPDIVPPEGAERENQLRLHFSIRQAVNEWLRPAVRLELLLISEASM